MIRVKDCEVTIAGDIRILCEDLYAILMEFSSGKETYHYVIREIMKKTLDLDLDALLLKLSEFIERE